MTNTTAIQALIDAVEAGGRFLLTPCHRTDEFGGSKAYLCRDAYNGSLDAAMALHKAVLPGWDLRIEDNVSGCVCQIGPAREEFTASIRAVSFDNPARAWLLAALRAMLTQK